MLWGLGSNAPPTIMRRLALNLFRYRSLLATLTSRELKARYRGSVLGYLWSLVNPVLLLLVYSFVFTTIFQPRDPNASPYALYLAAGIFPWFWLSNSWVEGTGALLANSGLIRKASFPAELLPVVSVLANLVHFSFALPVIGVALAIARLQGIEVGGWGALAVPLIVVLQLPMTAGVTLAFAALNAHFKDVKDILGNLLTLLFFMTPILYTLKTVRPYRLVYPLVAYNPFTPFIRAFQEALFVGAFPSLGLWLGMAVSSLALWTAGAWIFDRLSDTLGEAV